MPTFEKTTRKYYTISKEDNLKGLIRHKDATGQVFHFGGIEGILTSIELVKDEYEGQEQIKWHFRFEDKTHSMVEILQIGEQASAARGLIISLFSCTEAIGWVSVQPYRNEHEGKTYTNVSVRINGKEVEWRDDVVENLPEIKTESYKGQRFVDDVERRKYIRALAHRVMEQKIAGTIVHEDGTQATYNGEEAPEQPVKDGIQQAKDIYEEAEPSSGHDDNDPLEINHIEDDDLPF